MKEINITVASFMIRICLYTELSKTGYPTANYMLEANLSNDTSPHATTNVCPILTTPEPHDNHSATSPQSLHNFKDFGLR